MEIWIKKREYFLTNSVRPALPLYQKPCRNTTKKEVLWYLIWTLVPNQKNAIVLNSAAYWKDIIKTNWIYSWNVRMVQHMKIDQCNILQTEWRRKLCDHLNWYMKNIWQNTTLFYVTTLKLRIDLNKLNTIKPYTKTHSEHHNHWENLFHWDQEQDKGFCFYQFYSI